MVRTRIHKKELNVRICLVSNCIQLKNRKPTPHPRNVLGFLAQYENGDLEGHEPLLGKRSRTGASNGPKRGIMKR